MSCVIDFKIIQAQGDVLLRLRCRATEWSSSVCNEEEEEENQIQL
jgi:hypothetical protein